MHLFQKTIGSWVKSRCAHMLAREWKSCDLNCRPWSVVMVCGLPKRVIHPDSLARTTVSAVMSIRGTDSGQRVNWSIAVRQYQKQSDVGGGPTMFMCACWNRSVGMPKSHSGVMVCLVTFDRWQDWHTHAPTRHSFWAV
jgi:hypothetical protein